MQQLTLFENKAAYYANMVELHKEQAVINAVRCGAELVKIKESLSHGQFIPWIEANMPISRKQCHKYMRLYEKKPELESNVSSTRHLSIDSELMFLSVDNEIEAEVREVTEEEDLNQKQIRELTKKLEEAKSENKSLKVTKEKWLKEKEDAKNKAKELEENLKIAQNSEKRLRDTISEEVDREVKDQLKIYDERIQKEQREKEELEKKIKTLKRQKDNAVKEGVKRELEKHQLEIDRMQYNLDLTKKSIKELEETRKRLDKEVGIVVDQRRAIKEIHDSLKFIAVELHEVASFNKPAKELIEDWGKILSQMKNGVSVLEDWIDCQS